MAMAALRKNDSSVQRGYLMPIGGAEDKTARRLILNRFVELSGGPQARIAIIPAASETTTATGLRYCQIFENLNVAASYCLDITDRQQANDPACIDVIDSCTGIFMTGGDQVKLLALIGGTLLEKKIHARFAAGATIAGTSAGASAMSRHMIAFGRSGGTPSQRMVQIAAGLGLIENVTIDQHFRQRDRMGRLMTAIAYNPGVLGIGVDEDTAFIIGPDDQCEVIGSGSVTVVDGADLEYSDIHAVKAHGPISNFGFKVHMLAHGCGYDLNRRLPKRAAHLPRQPFNSSYAGLD